MFGTGHPQPPHRKEVAMQIVRQQARSFAATKLTVDMPDDSHVAAPPADLPVGFSVVYTMGEYLGMVREHAAFLLRHEAPDVKRRRVLRPLQLGAAACGMAAVAALAGGPGWVSGLLLVLGMLAFGSLPGAVPFWTFLLCPPVFLFKQRRMPRSDFVIDGAGIERTTKQGVLRRSWDEVTAVRRYSRGYLLMLRRGAIPIPFRCLDSGQRERLRAFMAARPAAA